LEALTKGIKIQNIRLKHAGTEENVIAVDELVGLINYEGQKQTHHLTLQISQRWV